MEQPDQPVELGMHDAGVNGGYGIGDVLAQMALGEKKVMLGGQAIDLAPFALRADDPPWRP